MQLKISVNNYPDMLLIRRQPFLVQLGRWEGRRNKHQSCLFI